MRTGTAQNFYWAANLFPLNRDFREAPGYYTTTYKDYAHIDWLVEAIKHDPNAADLRLGLAVMRLRMGDIAAYNQAAMDLKRFIGVEVK